MSSFVSFLNVLAWLIVFVTLPIGLGIGICRALRVKEFGARTAFVLFTIFLATLPFALKVVQNEVHAYRTDDGEWVSASNVKDGVDSTTKQATKVEADTGKLLRAIPLTGKEFKREGDKWVLAQYPDVEVIRQTTFDINRWKDALSYGIDLAGGTNLVYELDASQAGSETIDGHLMDRMVGAVTKRINPAGTREIVVRRVGTMRIEVILPGADPAVVEETKDLMTRLGTLEFSIVANERDHAEIIRAAKATSGTDVIMSGKIVAKWRTIAPDKDARGREIPNTQFDGNPEIAVRQKAGRPKGYEEVLILYEADESKQITGKLLKRANPTRDSNGAPAVGFHFSQAGGYRFHELTSQNKPRKDGSKRLLAVMLNNEVHTAPSINQPISENGIIESGRFTEKEVAELVSVLNAGALPVPIKKTPISEFTISPTLGFDVTSKAKLALWVSSLAVIAFMASYYFVAGLVADFALLLNLLFIVALMAFVNAAFTLPGLAGLVLSAGMSVDSNVLIYERIREESARGASLRMSIHNGFDKAFTAIFDSHITTLITSVILYMVGTEQVKGFAVSLFIGLVMNLYTAVFVSRLIVNIMERSRVIKRLKMLGMIGVSNFDFVSKQKFASIASALVITTGLTAFFMRGQANYDIDFTGGISVTMQFNEPQNSDTVRSKLEEAFSKNITVDELTPTGEKVKGTFFRLRVANEGEHEVQPKEIEDKVSKAFPDMLVRKNLNFGEIQPIATAAGDKSAADREGPGKDGNFAGGHQVVLNFTDARGEKGKNAEIAPATFSRYLVEELARLKPSSQPEGENGSDPESLFVLEGTAGSGVAAAEGKVKTFHGMILKAAPEISLTRMHSALTNISEMMKNTPVFDEVTSFESSVASEAKTNAVLAIVASLVALVSYIWFRFKNLAFGLAIVVALVHDVLVSLGAVAVGSYLANTVIGPPLLLTDFKINMPMLAAFMTIVGYQLNDTIVIFDRLREIRGKTPVITKEMINLTVNQTLSRTILTNLTVIITVAILYGLGGEGLHGFAFVMLIGSIAGTYSTVYIASPLVVYLMKHAALSGGTGERRSLAGPGAAPAVR